MLNILIKNSSDEGRGSHFRLLTGKSLHSFALTIDDT